MKIWKIYKNSQRAKYMFNLPNIYLLRFEIEATVPLHMENQYGGTLQSFANIINLKVLLK